MNNMNEHLKAYIDGELPADQARQVEQALQRDASLRKEFDEMRRISSTLREASVSPTVTGLDATLAALGKNKKAAPKRSFARLLPALGLVGACAVAMVMIGRSGTNSRMARYNDELPMPGAKRDIGHQPAEAMQGATASSPATQSRMGEDAEQDLALPTPPVYSGFEDSARGAAGGRSSLDLKGKNELKAGELRKSNGVVMARVYEPSQVVKTGDIHLKVDGAKAIVDKIAGLTKDLKGLVDSSDLSGDANSGMAGTMVIRVPVASFDKAMTELQKYGKVTGISSSAQDVTTQVVGNDAKLRTMKGQESAYQNILSGVKKVNDVLSVKDRLDAVQQEIATLEAEQKSLKNQAALSTIRISITQPAPKKAVAGMVKDDWMNNTWTGAWNGLSFAGRRITEALIYLVVFCPVWIPIIVLANLLGRRLRQLA